MNQKKKKGFSMGTKKRRPLWQDMIRFSLVSLVLWGGLHVALNWNAFEQIIVFRWDNLQVSLVSQPEPSADTPAIAQEQKAQADFLQKREQVVFRNRHIKPRNQAQNLFENMPVYPSDNRIIIPRIGKNVPLVNVPDHDNWIALESNIQEALRDGVVVHPISQDPSQNGNFFATGHSSYYTWDPGRFKDVFALLHEVKIGDTVEVYWEGKKYVYKIEEEKVVPPTEVSVLDQPDDRRELTLMTCTPIGTNKNRLILKGTLVEG